MAEALLIVVIGAALILLVLSLLSALELNGKTVDAVQSTLAQADAMRRIEQETTRELMQALAWYEERVDGIVQEARACLEEEGG